MTAEEQLQADITIWAEAIEGRPLTARESADLLAVCLAVLPKLGDVSDGPTYGPNYRIRDSSTGREGWTGNVDFATKRHPDGVVETGINFWPDGETTNEFLGSTNVERLALP